MPITKSTAETSTKKLVSQLFSLNPSTIISLFEIDITDIAFDTGVISPSEKLFNPIAGIFRFHNNISLISQSLYFQEKEYFALPIHVEGFELSSSGTLPTPKLRLSVNDDGVPLLAVLKEKIFLLGDLIGAKIKRIRTFAKYLDARNFLTDELPEGFEPDANIYFPEDIYYIDRKSHEDKFNLEFELSSIFDVEGIKLPGRLVIANKCMWQYRGEGCLYEYDSRKTEIHGSGTLPGMAPPVANDRDEDISEIIGPNVQLIDRGKWEPTLLYLKGHFVYLEKNNIKYYFVAASDNPPVSPPNTKYWIADRCSQTIMGCKKRWQSLAGGVLPYGGFPSCNKLTA